MQRIIMTMWFIVLGFLGACGDEGEGLSNSPDVLAIGRTATDAGMVMGMGKMEAGMQGERDAMVVVDGRPVDAMMVVAQVDAMAAPDSMAAMMGDVRVVPTGEPVIPENVFIVVKKMKIGPLGGPRYVPVSETEYFAATTRWNDDEGDNLLTGCVCSPSRMDWGTVYDFSSGSKAPLNGPVIARIAKKADHDAMDLMIKKWQGFPDNGCRDQALCIPTFLELTRSGASGHYAGTLEQVRTGSRCTCQ